MFNIARFITQLFPRIPSQDARERAYLDGSVSLYDLECREREIASGKFTSPYLRAGWQ